VSSLKSPKLVLLFLVLLFASSEIVMAQSDNLPVVKIPGSDDRKEPESTSILEMTIKQQISRRKKEYEELLKNGEDALKLSQQLEDSYDANKTFSSQDLQRLQELEKLVSKIREELGGSNDDNDRNDDLSEDSSENEARQSTGSAFKFLYTSTVKLVDELKKSTRFSISVAAIQATNSIIKFARFLRLRK
jgi:hypothetical protein